MKRPSSHVLAPCLLAITGITACSIPLAKAPPTVSPQYKIQAVAASHSVTVFPETDTVSLTGYSGTTNLKIEVLRVDHANYPLDYSKYVVVGTATGRPAGGALDVHAQGGPGVCWQRATPDIVPNDIVRVTMDSGAVDETRVADVSCIPPKSVGGVLTIHCNATDNFGNPLPIGELTQRMVSTGVFQRTGRTDITATAAGAEGTIAYNVLPVAPGDFIASYAGLSGLDIARGMAAVPQVIWKGVTANAGTESTVFEIPAPGAGVEGCFPGMANAIMTTDPPLLTPANAGQPVTITGAAAPDIAQVSVSLNNGTPVKISLAPSEDPKAWSVTLPAPAGAGPVTVEASFFPPAGPPVSLGTTAVAPFQDRLVIPQAAYVKANPPAGIYPMPQAVELTAYPLHSQIYYTTDGSAPTTASTLYTVPIQLNRQATIKYFAVLPDHTTTPIQSASYTPEQGFFVEAEPAGGTYDITQFVTLKANRPGDIHYTLDGSEPTDQSPVYADQIMLNHSAELKFRAIDLEGNASPVQAWSFFVVDTTPPTITPNFFTAPPSVTALRGTPLLRFATSEGADLYYTTDGTTPTTASTKYDPVTGLLLTPAMRNRNNPARRLAATVNVMAVDYAGNQSAVLTGLYSF